MSPAWLNYRWHLFPSLVSFPPLARFVIVQVGTGRLTTQTADQDSSQDQLENGQQPLIQPQNTWARFLSSALSFFQRLYHVILPRMPFGSTTAETVRFFVIPFRGWYPSKIPNAAIALPTTSAERPSKRLREGGSPSSNGIAKQTVENESIKNSDKTPEKRLKEETTSTNRIVGANTASTSWNIEEINTTHVFDDAIEDRGIYDQDKESTPGETGLGAQLHGSHDVNALRSNCFEMPLNSTTPVPRSIVAQVTTQPVTSLQDAHDFIIRDNAHITNIGVSNVSVSNYGGTFAFDLGIMERFMEKYTSLNAVHDSPVQDPNRICHPETRQNVLKQMRSWFNNSDGSESIVWLHGPAGVGKSAIAQTIVCSYGRQKVLATFFCRSDPSRNDGNKLFTTIAWQLALLIPTLKIHIIKSLHERPDLPRKDVETQFQELIVKPLTTFSQTQLSAPVIIIDGVDECVDERLQRRILKVIGNAVNDPDFPLRFLICSRPEVHIEEAVNSFQCALLRLDLAKLDDANHDIEKYLRAELSRIASKQDLGPTWPDEKRIRECIYKSSGHFGYASTVIKIVDDEYNSAPTQLDIVLGLRPHGGKSPFAELDGLYMEILQRQEDWDFLNDILSLLLGYAFSEFIPTNDTDHYSILMNMPEKELCRKLRRMPSVLKVDSCINVHQQSFLDFLQDSSRSGQYHISQRAAERRCLDLIIASIVRHVPIVFQQPDRHEQHFSLWISIKRSMLSVKELQEALQPLVHIQDKLLSMEKSSSQRILQCNKCNILFLIRDLLSYLTCLQETSKHEAYHAALAVLTEHVGMFGPLAPFIATEVEKMLHEKSDLDICLSSVLMLLREMKFAFLSSAMMNELMCSLLSFDYVEIAMRVCSISDAQVLVDGIDYLINNSDILSLHTSSTAIARKAARLALEIHARIPILPRSLFRPVDLSHRFVLNVYYSFMSVFTPMFISRILDCNYVLRISCMFEDGGLGLLCDSMNTHESIKQWRQSNPSSDVILRVMLEVAKTFQYVDSMDVLLESSFDLDEIFLDSEYHVKIIPWGSILSLTHLSSEEVHQRNIFNLGCTFYELYFDVELYWYRSHCTNYMTPDPGRPSEPEISEELWQVIQQCYSADPKSRPTIDEVVKEMESWIIP